MKSLLLFLFCSFFVVDMDVDSKEKLPKFFRNNYAEVPGGTMSHEGKSVSVEGFYMFKTEITNLQFKEFLYDNPDYQLETTENEFITTYQSHPAYHDYPVVMISVDQAKDYCAWLEKKLAVSLNIPEEDIEVRLPSKSEWIYAGLSGDEGNIYAWQGQYLRDADGKFLCNFRKDISHELVTYDEETKTYKVIEDKLLADAILAAPAESFLVNQFGLYNMSGNVAELVLESDIVMGGSYNSPGYDVRIRSEKKYKQADMYTGFRPIVKFKK